MLDLLDISKTLNQVEKCKTPFYIEYNHYKMRGMGISEAVNELIRNNFIDELTASKCINKNSIWYIRYYPENRDGYYEIYASSFNDVMLGLLQEIDAYTEKYK